jgi:hypothetical protein
MNPAIFRGWSHTCLPESFPEKMGISGKAINFGFEVSASADHDLSTIGYCTMQECARQWL